MQTGLEPALVLTEIVPAATKRREFAQDGVSRYR